MLILMSNHRSNKWEIVNDSWKVPRNVQMKEDLHAENVGVGVGVGEAN